MPTEQATTTGSPSGLAPHGDGDARLAQVGPRDGGLDRAAGRRSPIRAGSATRRARSQRSGTSWLSGWGSAPGGGCPARSRCTRASWSTGSRSPWSIAGHLAVGVADPDLQERRVERRPGVLVPCTTRATSRPRTSPRTTPCSHDDLEVGVDEQPASSAARRGGAGGRRPDRARRRRGSVVPSTAHTVGAGANSTARRASDPGVALGQQVEVGRPRGGRPTPGPGPSDTDRVGVEQQPAPSPGHERRRRRGSGWARARTSPRWGRARAVELGGEERSASLLRRVVTSGRGLCGARRLDLRRLP